MWTVGQGSRMWRVNQGKKVWRVGQGEEGVEGRLGEKDVYLDSLPRKAYFTPQVGTTDVAAHGMLIH